MHSSKRDQHDHIFIRSDRRLLAIYSYQLHHDKHVYVLLYFTKGPKTSSYVGSGGR